MADILTIIREKAPEFARERIGGISGNAIALGLSIGGLIGIGLTVLGVLGLLLRSRQTELTDERERVKTQTEFVRVGETDLSPKLSAFVIVGEQRMRRAEGCAT